MGSGKVKKQTRITVHAYSMCKGSVRKTSSRSISVFNRVHSRCTSERVSAAKCQEAFGVVVDPEARKKHVEVLIHLG